MRHNYVLKIAVVAAAVFLGNPITFAWNAVVSCESRVRLLLLLRRLMRVGMAVVVVVVWRRLP